MIKKEEILLHEQWYFFYFFLPYYLPFLFLFFPHIHKDTGCVTLEFNANNSREWKNINKKLKSATKNINICRINVPFSVPESINHLEFSRIKLNFRRAVKEARKLGESSIPSIRRRKSIRSGAAPPASSDFWESGAFSLPRLKGSY